MLLPSILSATGGNDSVNQFAAIFPAKLTAVTLSSGVSKYSWTEQILNPATNLYQDADGPRTGTATLCWAVEINNGVQPIATSPPYTIVQMRFRGFVGGDPVYEFVRSGPSAYIACVTTTIPAMNGVTPGQGVVTLYGQTMTLGVLTPIQTGVTVWNAVYFWPFPVGKWVQLDLNAADGLWYASGPPPFPFVTNMCAGTGSGSGSGSGGDGGNCDGGLGVQFTDAACCPSVCWPGSLHLTLTSLCGAFNGHAFLDVAPTGGFFQQLGGPTFNGRPTKFVFGCNGSGMVLFCYYNDGGEVVWSSQDASPNCDGPSASGSVVISDDGGDCDGQMINWSVTT